MTKGCKYFLRSLLSFFLSCDELFISLLFGFMNSITLKGGEGKKKVGCDIYLSIKAVLKNCIYNLKWLICRTFDQMNGYKVKKRNGME